MTQDWSDIFGELRSLAHGEPSRDAWDALLRCAKDAQRADATRWREEAAPYLRGALSRWPAARCEAASEDVWWLRRDPSSQPAPSLDIARALRINLKGQLTDLDRWTGFIQHPALTHIEHLLLESGGVDLPRWRALLDSLCLPALRDLTLLRCSFGAEGLSAFAESPLAQQLTALELSGCQVGRHGGYALRRLHAPHLTDLSLVGCHIGAAGIRALAQHAQIQPVRLTLDAQDLRAQDAPAALVASPHTLSRVSELKIVHEAYHHKFPMVELLERCAPLHVLELHNLHHLRPATLAAALAHPHLAALHTLTTSGDRRLWPRLLDSPVMASLRHLTISLDLRSQQALALLAQHPAMANLHTLRLQDCVVSPDDLRALLDSPYTGAALRAGHPWGAVTTLRAQDDRLYRFTALRFDEVLNR